MKIVLETKPNTEYRKNELEKLREYLTSIYDVEDPFGCRTTLNCCDTCDPVKCIAEYVEDIIEEIDREGVYYC